MIGSLAEIASRKPEVTDFTIDGHCSQCGACCSDYLPLSQKEIDRIHKYVKAHNLHEHTSLVVMGNFLDATCPFRNSVKKRCDIYEVRPEICRCFRCDQGMVLIDENKKLFYQKNTAISMRGEFFGNQAAKTYGMFLGALLEFGGGLKEAVQ